MMLIMELLIYAEIDVPTHSEAIMAQTEAGSGDDNTGLRDGLAALESNMQVSVKGKLNLELVVFGSKGLMPILQVHMVSCMAQQQ